MIIFHSRLELASEPGQMTVSSHANGNDFPTKVIQTGDTITVKLGNGWIATITQPEGPVVDYTISES